MKSGFSLKTCLCSVAVSLACCGGAAREADPRATYATDGWRMVWSEEFDAPGDLPDAAAWQAEVGFLRNHEPQYYTSNRVENCRVADGVLTLTARREKWPNPAWKDRRLGGWQRAREFADYTSASLRSVRSFHYGRVEIRAQMPGGRGAWPALWFLGTNLLLPKSDPARFDWPACGEIDLVEIWGDRPNRVAACLHTAKRGPTGEPGEKYVARNLHTVTGGGDRTFGKPGEEPWNGFHTYTLDWHEDRLFFFYDGRLFAQADLSRSDWPDGRNPFRKPMFLIMNLALGGWNNPVYETDTVDPKTGKTIPAAKFPMEMKIDWVRYYQKDAATDKPVKTN